MLDPVGTYLFLLFLDGSRAQGHLGTSPEVPQEDSVKPNGAYFSRLLKPEQQERLSLATSERAPPTPSGGGLRLLPVGLAQGFRAMLTGSLIQHPNFDPRNPALTCSLILMVPSVLVSASSPEFDCNPGSSPYIYIPRRGTGWEETWAPVWLLVPTVTIIAV